MNPADPEYMSFEKIALPAAVERGLGNQAMKSLGNGKLLQALTVQDCINYARSLPTHCIALGFTSLEQVEDDVRFAQQHERLAGVAGPDLEDWKKPLRGSAKERQRVLHDDV